MPDLPRPLVLLDIVEEHFAELDALWEQRENWIFAPDWTLDQLARHEARAGVHLEALVEAQGVAADVALPALGNDDRAAATAATITLMTLGHPELDQAVVAALAGGKEADRNGVRLGLRQTDVKRLARDLAPLGEPSADPAVRVAVLDALAYHRLPAPEIEAASLLEKLPDDSLIVLFHALARAGGPWTAADLEHALRHPSPRVQRAGLEASARIGLPGLAGLARNAATRKEVRTPEALAFLGVVGGAADLSLLERGLQVEGFQAAALAGLGALGTVEALPPIVQAMSDPALQLGAGAAFRRITGAEGIEAEERQTPPEGLSEDERELFTAEYPPDPVRATAWLQGHREQFAAGGRFQCGHPVPDQGLGDTFPLLSLEARRDVYLGARARDSKRTPDLELEARARVQARAAG